MTAELYRILNPFQISFQEKRRICGRQWNSTYRYIYRKLFLLDVHFSKTKQIFIHKLRTLGVRYVYFIGALTQKRHCLA